MQPHSPTALSLKRIRSNLREIHYFHANRRENTTDASSILAIFVFALLGLYAAPEEAQHLQVKALQKSNTEAEG